MTKSVYNSLTGKNTNNYVLLFLISKLVCYIQSIVGTNRYQSVLVGTKIGSHLYFRFCND